ncbi:hypothetical protein ONA02_01995 [Mycoplasmopsis felis]|uniref:hypothetical protein n=1 Tax=Mycoplasmopsis felis TaxID=33923 RepID=UPI002286B18E|nr:hypothetical protein [Mycoplasmopsis felis]WAM02596.1 hypothetical protein ONA02_01995 [Mycoplasmopsis felis]
MFFYTQVGNTGYKTDKEFIFDVKSDLLSALNVFLSNVKEPSKVIGSSPKF